MVQDKNKEDSKDNGKMTVSEAGHKGGEAVIDKYGPEHMAEIGRKDGEHSHGGHNVEEKQTTIMIIIIAKEGYIVCRQINKRKSCQKRWRIIS